MKQLFDKVRKLTCLTGPVLLVLDKNGEYIWSEPGTAHIESAICLKFVTSKGKIALIEGGRVRARSKYVSDKDADSIWRRELKVYPIFEKDEDWVEVGWVQYNT
jgi:hypothetical protein